MKLTTQSFEIIEQKDFALKGIKQFIERCARVSYKSEDKMTDTSYENFVTMLINKGHLRPLEFSTVHLKMPLEKFNDLVTLCARQGFWNSYWLKHTLQKEKEDTIAYITTNYRYYRMLADLYPVYTRIDIKDFFDDTDSSLYRKRHTVHMIISRGIMDEFRTHIGLSHLAESTRFVNYSKDKFGNEITFIIPNWINTKCPNKKQESPDVSDIGWSTAMFNAEASYMNLLKRGWKPQQAREVLPLSVKSELISCGFTEAWLNFFYRRCAKDAHPMAIEIATAIQEKFKQKGYIL